MTADTALASFSTPDQHLGQQQLNTASKSETKEVMRSENLQPLSNQSEIAALGRAGHEGKPSQRFFRAQPSVLVWANMVFAVSANVLWAFAYKVDQDSAD